MDKSVEQHKNRVHSKIATVLRRKVLRILCFGQVCCNGAKVRWIPDNQHWIYNSQCEMTCFMKTSIELRALEKVLGLNPEARRAMNLATSESTDDLEDFLNEAG